MEIVEKSAPHLRKPNAHVVRMMRDVAIALSPLVIFAIVQYGLSAFWILLVAVLSMVGTEYVYYQIIDRLNGEKFSLNNKSFTIYNFTVVVSGLIYGLTLSDEVPLVVVAIGGIIGVFLAKLIFGGMGQNIFNIAAFARVFVALSFGGAIVYDSLVDADAGATVLGMLAGDYSLGTNVTETYSYWTMFSGIGMPGSLGEVSGLLILVGALYMFLRKSFDIFVPLTYVGTVFLLALSVMFVTDADIWFPLTHVLAGGLLFGAVFMATDPITIPTTRPGRIYFAFGLGVVTFIIRMFGNLPEGVVFAILIMNMFVPAIDYHKWAKNKFTVKSATIFMIIVLATLALTAVGVNYVG